MRHALNALLACVTIAASISYATPPTPASTTPTSWQPFVNAAAAEFGPEGRAAAEFLAEHAPPRDASLPADLLLSNLRLAMQARDEFLWARNVPAHVFHNDVLPYAIVDETREPWRESLLPHVREVVAGATSATDAAQRLNRDLFDRFGVEYNTARSKTNQSPSEAIAEGKATCTGLSILLVSACRTAGIPARIAGVANWADKRGNHTWVEIYDNGTWYFTGADEFTPAGLNRGWFVADAARATPGSREHAVWASSWRRTEHTFPMIWSPADTTVPAIDVTTRYTKPNEATPDTADHAQLFLRLWTTRDGTRIAASITHKPTDDKHTTIQTRAGTTDLNDMPSLTTAPGEPITLSITHEGQTRTARITPHTAGPHTIDLYWDELALTKEQSQALIEQIYNELAAARREEARAAIEAGQITAAGHTMRFLEKTFGEPPPEGHALYISLHGGGGAPPEINDRQWQNQINLYEPKEGIYIAPRAPTDTWNLWHQAHIDPLVTKLIETYAIARDIDLNRVYLMGYSAGGDGVYQLAPRIPDRFAAAAMMAGHPNETSPIGLRNLPFAILMGADDTAYDRAAVAERFGSELRDRQELSPTGYTHRTIIYPGLGHWMERRDAEILPWLASFDRTPRPTHLTWKQDDVTHTRFYWLAIDNPKPRTLITATAHPASSDTTQAISIDTDDVNLTTTLTLLLHDDLLDLDQPIRIIANGTHTVAATPTRTERDIRAALTERLDPNLAYTAVLPVLTEQHKLN